ncbi:3-isopropylmalate dehydratase large subunit [Candidatus Bathyarchaeota archaeon]|jgi:3-isopropylmalate/(R)-2-methylmalate dehydratase large subunit|nr:3-isopropylmalate dehydratase large subunit [Candidatus Bathyarchaeota archaeon]MDP6049253.1 3-isopropylmalate dehydratase large subunit [Candidatus Bathyarchaeota archaeon]
MTSTEDQRGRTISEKILARASEQKDASAGEIVKARVDVAMMPDLTTILSVKAMKAMGRKKVWDNTKIVPILDHVAPASTLMAATVHRDIRAFVKEQGITNFYDVESGVCHQVLPEKGHVKPGYLVIGADSHTCTHGAFGAFATGVGSTDMGAILATGKIWLRVPETIRVQVEGILPEFVTPKDVILKTAGLIGADGATYNALEFHGNTISKMSVSGRMTLCNMAIELGGKAGIVEPDKTTYAYLRDRTDGVFNPVFSDEDASYKMIQDVPVDDLEPQIACPHKVDNVKPISEVEGSAINQSFIGSCTNGRLEDLRVAASILKGKKVHPDTRLLVVPASNEVYLEALKAGIIQTIVESGAIFSNPSCGACFGGHIGLLAPGEIGLTTSNRNFQGRQGSPEAFVYLSSPAVAAASAIKGVITDPRDLR